MNQQDLYLGRLVDEQDQVTSEPLMYPLNHLTTHALLLGATGSGKTGLALVLIEEVLLQGVPVLLLDVKGDLSNLLLTFPELAQADFAPWVDVDAAQRNGMTPENAAQAAANRWREGLGEWDIAPERLAELRRRAALSLYTPGSRGGRPVDILARFSAAPSGDDPDAAAMRAQGLASALLGLAGIDADPLRSREHILLTTLIRNAWEMHGALDVPGLIQLVQQPPIERVGVFDLESFFPQKDRFELALMLNNLIAAPGFERWHEGDPLEIDRFLSTSDGRPRATVFYLAHLPEEQRRFFVTLFLEELRAWIRTQPGTQTLRALLAFDEIFGYLPPHPSNPPTKVPLMALVKQGRAAGLGVALSTQNPADLDYKGLGNIGTWFIGALRTDRDKRRVMEGMEGSLAQSGTRPADIEKAISRLKSRQFLMHDARAGQLAFLNSRWAMSYLRGPLTLAEAQSLATDARSGTEQPDVGVTFTSPAAPAAAVPTPVPAKPAKPERLTHPPAVDPTIPQAFLPATVTDAWAKRSHQGELPAAAKATLVYCPYLLGVGVAHIFDERANVNLSDEQVWRVAASSESWDLRWDQGDMLDLRLEDLSSQALGEGLYEPLPKGLGRKSAYPKWESALKTHIYRSTQLTLWNCTPLKLYSRTGESKRDFLERCRAEMERAKQEELATERQKFEQKMNKLEERIRREELELDQQQDELGERKREELLSGAESVLSLFSKRRRRTRALSDISRQRRYVKKAEAGVEESIEEIKLYEEQMEQLETSWQAAAGQIIAEWESALEQIKEITVRAKRSDVEIQFCGLAWFPFWEVETEGERILLPAYVP